MIHLTRLNGHLLAVNSDLIQFMESSPDTTLTLTTGEKLVVHETPDEVIERALEFRARLIAEAARTCPGGLTVISGAAWLAHAALPVTDSHEWEGRALPNPAHTR